MFLWLSILFDEFWRIRSVVFLLLFGTGLTSQAASVVLSDEWRFQRGDRLEWARPSFDDSKWKTIQAGQGWEAQGFPNYDGYAWYRLRFSVPVSIQQSPLFQQHESLVLRLGRIDDVDATYFNGVLIGQTGEFPPEYEPAWGQDRRYHVPADQVHWGKENVLAIRVYDGESVGGLLSAGISLGAANWDELVSAELIVDSETGLYAAGTELQPRFVITNRSQNAFQGSLSWRLERDSGEELAIVRQEVAISGESAENFGTTFSLKDPGCYRVSATLADDRLSTKKRDSRVIGYDVGRIHSVLTRRSDFDAFWRATKKALAAVPPEYELTRRPDLDSSRHRVWEVMMNSLGQVRVGGWLQVPHDIDNPVPVLIRVPGYGQDMRPLRQGPAMAVFSFNVRGHGNAQRDVAGTPEDFWIRGLDDREGYYYQGAYADCIRAVDFVVSRPELDASRIAITGGSQGGGLSLVAAGLDGRIRLCAPDIAFLCDWVNYFQTSHWPEMEHWIAAEETRTWETTLQTLSYFDALNLAERIRCPVFMSLGLQDAVCPPSTIWAVYNRIPGSKNLHVYPEAEHWVPPTHREATYAWIQDYFDRWE